MSEKGHEHDSERLAQAEPGIKLKISNDKDEQLISSAVSSITDQLPRLADDAERNGDDGEPPFDIVPAPESVEPTKEEKKPEEIFQELKRLPSLLPAAAIAFFFWNEPVLMLPCTYFYWIFCAYRTTSVARSVLGAKNLSPNNVLTFSLIPCFVVLSSYIVFLMVRFMGVYGTPIEIYRNMAIVMTVCYAFYQFKWPTSCSIAIKNYLGKQDILPRVPAPLVHFGTALAFNLLPLYCLGGGFIMNSLPGLRQSLVASAIFFVLLLVVQYFGFYILRLRLYGAIEEKNPGFKAFLQRAKKVEPKVSDDDIVVRYRAFAEYERWFKHRFKERSSKKAIFMGVTLTVFLLAGAPQWCLTLLTQLPMVSGGGVAAGAAGAASINFLNMFQGLLIGLMLGIGGIYVSKPTHVGFSRKGARFLWRHKIFEANGTYIRWDAFKRIRIFLPKGKTSPTDQHILFEAGSKTGPERDMELKLSSIIHIDDKERILKAIEGYAPGVERDASVLQALQPPADHSYTELWLQALAAPPKRERFKPLSEGAKLNDGRFKVAGQLGVGGQGTAYLAYDMHTSSTVVLKEFILPVYVDVTVRKQALERFENEARILKQLDHQQIVQLIDFFVEDHRSYLVLEHIDGRSLKQVVEEEGKLSEERVLELTQQMCTILTYLHGLIPPVVHRDFTPDNLILRNDGKLKLVDFNVAQQTDSTATGTVVGKHSYLPPEQFRGTPVPQSDLYSLGATLHFLLTGVDPEPISVSHPRRVNPEVSESMDIFVARATAMTLEARHQTIEELEQELRYFFGKLPGTESIFLDDDPSAEKNASETESSSLPQEPRAESESPEV